MNKNNLKSYAPQARRDFIAAVTARAQQLGITATQTQPVTVSGDVAIIDGTTWPAKVARQRERLLKRIQRHGFGQTMEEVAYTWFNRFAALRYMELHDFLDHGHRALSSRDGGLPELLRQAAEVTLPGLSAAKVQEMQLAGNRDDELYKQLLVAQCNELSRSMPFLFERIDDDTELLLPDNLLRTDSIVAKLVAGVPEEDWQEIEVIGWLYQFYISEKKDQVIGKVVKSEDIPAATQLFTPNWIVQYLVQNSVGRLWLMANPTSTLASEWPYYIQPAEQAPEVQAQLDALIQTRIREDGDALNPESITVLDPACGSGHILVVAYDVLKAIYLERGYRFRDIPRLILEKNLYGLDIDDRAAQMAGFALLMKARADDRRLLNDPDNPPKLNVLSLQESKGLNYEELSTHLAPFGVQRATLWGLIEAFEHAKTFGSLIQIPYQLKTQLEPLAQVLELAVAGGDMYGKQAAQDLQPFVRQAQILAMQFDAVVANPPYMGSKFHIPIVKSYLRDQYPEFEKDLFAAFTARNSYFGKSCAEIAVMTSNVWMFLSSYEEMRCWLIDRKSLSTLIQLSNSGFDGATVFICAFTFSNQEIRQKVGSFVRLTDFSKPAEQGLKTLEAIGNPNCTWFYTSKPDDFKKIPGSPIAYWASFQVRTIFENFQGISDVANAVVGLQTGDNGKFLRLWHEVDVTRIGFNMASRTAATQSSKKWFPYNKGGDYRRWYGNHEWVVNWENDGREIRGFGTEGGGKARSRAQNVEYYFQPSVSWSFISSSYFGVRYFPRGFIFDVAGSSAFPKSAVSHLALAAFLCSAVAPKLMSTINPTLNFQAGNVGQLPFLQLDVDHIGEKCIEISRNDWNQFETSWEFATIGLQKKEGVESSIISWWSTLSEESDARFQRMKVLEEENNRVFINACSLQDELTPEVPEDQITLTRADRDKDCQRLISYAIGCMMGRYSLDEPGLIYAHAGNVGFDPSRYTRFPADADGILPVTDEHWFEDDAPARVREFLQTVWGPTP